MEMSNKIMMSQRTKSCDMLSHLQQTEVLWRIASIVHTVPERQGIVTDAILDRRRDQFTKLILKEDAVDG